MEIRIAENREQASSHSVATPNVLRSWGKQERSSAGHTEEGEQDAKPDAKYEVTELTNSWHGAPWVQEFVSICSGANQLTPLLSETF